MKEELIWVLNHSPSDTAEIHQIDKKYLLTYFKDTIFRRCGIELKVVDKDTSKYSRFNYSLTGASLIRSYKPNMFILEPFDDQVELNITMDSEPYLEKKFPAPELPLPHYKIKADNNFVDSVISAEANYLDVVFYQPYDHIRRKLPKDCRYKPAKIHYLFLSNDSIVGKVDVIDSVYYGLKNGHNQAYRLDNSINISQILKEVSVDKILIKVDTLNRVNYRNENIRVNINPIMLELKVVNNTINSTK